MKKYSTVVFDLDGTLLNTLEDLADAVNYVFRKFGWEEHTIDRVRMDVGNGIKKLVERSVPDGLNNPKFEESYETFMEYYQAHCQIKKISRNIGFVKKPKGQGLQDGNCFKQGCCAVSELNEIYFKKYIDVAIGENEAGGIGKKPAPDEVNLALEQLDSTKAESIYLGDSDVDKATADNSQLDCVLCQWGFRDLELLESLKPKSIIAKPEELKKY